MYYSLIVTRFIRNVKNGPFLWREWDLFSVKCLVLAKDTSLSTSFSSSISLSSFLVWKKSVRVRIIWKNYCFYHPQWSRDFTNRRCTLSMTFGPDYPLWPLRGQLFINDHEAKLKVQIHINAVRAGQTRVETKKPAKEQYWPQAGVTKNSKTWYRATFKTNILARSFIVKCSLSEMLSTSTERPFYPRSTSLNLWTFSRSSYVSWQA